MDDNALAQREVLDPPAVNVIKKAEFIIKTDCLHGVVFNNTLICAYLCVFIAFGGLFLVAYSVSPYPYPQWLSFTLLLLFHNFKLLTFYVLLSDYFRKTQVALLRHSRAEDLFYSVNIQLKEDFEIAYFTLSVDEGS